MQADTLISQMHDQYSEWEEVMGDKYPHFLLHILASKYIQKQEYAEQQRLINTRLRGLLIKEGVYATGI